MTDLEEETNKWEDFPYSRIGRINIIKNAHIYPREFIDPFQFLSKCQCHCL
jgi:hypothetical protein